MPLPLSNPVVARCPMCQEAFLRERRRNPQQLCGKIECREQWRREAITRNRRRDENAAWAEVPHLCTMEQIVRDYTGVSANV